jgi:anaerobic selenocysteine-containing dehydrogenase
MPLRKCNTTCPLDCFDSCSLEVIVDDKGDILSIEGNKEHPITKGFICEKGKKHLERVRNSSRLKYPMMKINGEWKKISWDEALHIIAVKTQEYIKEYGTRSIGLYSYAGAAGLLKNIENLFFDYIGETTKIYGSICLGAGGAAQKLDFGKHLGHSPEDTANSRTIIIWGRNPVDTNIHLVPYLKAAKERGAALILVDPLRTATAGICDKHIRIKPEGDAALACAVTKYILEKDLYDKDFASNHTLGFAELRSYLMSISMEALLELCGAGIEDIAMLAEKLALKKPAAVFIGYGMQRYPYGGAAVRCIDMLVALTGNVGIAGGGANYSNGVNDDYLDMNPFKVNTREHRMINRAMFGRTVQTLTEPPLKLLFISRSNPVLQLPNTNEVIKAMEKIEFKISLEHFLTDTAQMADIVLPVTYFLEEEDVVAPGMWSDHIGHIGKCLDSYYEARPEYEIYTELADRLNLKEFPKLSGQQWLELMLKPLIAAGLKLDELKEKGHVKNPAAEAVPWKEMSFATGSGKFEIIAVDELEECLKGIRTEQKERYRLITVHSRKSLHSQHLLDVEAAFPIVYIHPEDVLTEGINAGDVIKLSNENGSIEASVDISKSGDKGILYMNEGWWLKNGGSVNMLTPDGISDIGNMGIMNHCFCDIEKVRVN